MKKFGPFSVKATHRIVGEYSCEGASTYDLVVLRWRRLVIEVSEHGLVGQRLLVEVKLPNRRHIVLCDLYAFGKPANLRERLTQWAWKRAERLGFPERFTCYFGSENYDSNIYGGR